MRVGPVAFLFLVIVGWVVVRGVMLWPVPESGPGRTIVWASAGSPPVAKLSSLPPASLVSRAPVKPLMSRHAFAAIRLERTADVVRPETVVLAGFAPAEEGPKPAAERSITLPSVAGSGSLRSSRFQLSAWALIRGDVSPGLAAAGQLGGSQIGVRARHPLSKGVQLAARVSGPANSRRGKEAAVALDLRPFEILPVTVTVERRLQLDRGGRNAFGIGLSGGFDREVVRRIWIDGYAQAGLVGFRSRDAYVDGAIRTEREIMKLGSARIGAGAGLWGGAQPGASRMDVGPQIVLRAPLGKMSVRLGAEWRQRVAGNARPGSGSALSLGADF